MRLDVSTALVVATAFACAFGCGSNNGETNSDGPSAVKSSDKSITELSILGVDGVTNGNAIAITLPAGTDVTNLVPTISINGSSLTPASGVAQNFSRPVSYVVTAEDATTARYDVTVTVATASSKAITAFEFAMADNPALTSDSTATINGNAVSVILPTGTDATALRARFATTGKAVSIGGVTQTSGVSVNDFTNPVDYRVTAADGSTADYTVSVTVAARSDKDITFFDFTSDDTSLTSLQGGMQATITGTSITATFPSNVSVTNLHTTFNTTGQTVSVDGVVIYDSPIIESDIARDFTNPIVYEVTAADGSTKDYTVTVTVQPNAITAFSFLRAANPGLAADINGIIHGRDITVLVPDGTDMTSLKATFTSGGLPVTVGGVAQVSGVTTNDFSTSDNYNTPVDYLVPRADSSGPEDFAVQVMAGSRSSAGTLGLNAPRGVSVLFVVVNGGGGGGGAASVGGAAASVTTTLGVEPFDQISFEIGAGGAPANSAVGGVGGAATIVVQNGDSFDLFVGGGGGAGGGPLGGSGGSSAVGASDGGSAGGGGAGASGGPFGAAGMGGVAGSGGMAGGNGADDSGVLSGFGGGVGGSGTGGSGGGGGGGFGGGGGGGGGTSGGGGGAGGTLNRSGTLGLASNGGPIGVPGGDGSVVITLQ